MQLLLDRDVQYAIERRSNDSYLVIGEELNSYSHRKCIFNRFSFYFKACGFQILCRRNGTTEVDLKVSK